MNKMINYLGISIIFIAAYCLFAIKKEVQDLNYQLAETSKQINEERNGLNILKAEFAYLSAPARLKKLSDTHLELSSVKTTQMIQNPLNEHPKIASDEKLGAPIKLADKHMVRWRYKKSGKQYLHQASHKR
jgi:cell division protein FtsL